MAVMSVAMGSLWRGHRQGARPPALPAIWSEQAGYKEHADKLQAEATKLAAAAPRPATSTT